MASFNKVILMGNMTRDVELRHTPGGTAVADIGIAVNRRRKNGDSYEDETTFVDVTLWGRTAEIAAEYLRKGSPVHIDGRLHLDQWDDKESGQKRSKLKVVADNLQLIGTRGGADGGTQAPQSKPEAAKSQGQFFDNPAGGDDDIPF